MTTETFTGTNGNAWPSPWVTTAATADLQGNAARLVTAGSQYDQAFARRTGLDDGELTFKWQWTACASDSSMTAVVRGGTNFGDNPKWEVRANSDSIWLRSSGSLIDSDTSAVFVVNTWYWFRIRWEGDDIQARAWEDGDPEPTTWNVQATDPSGPTTGNVLLRIENGNDTTADSALFDDVTLAAITGGGIIGDVAAELVDAKGDLLAGTAPDTLARLPVGTNGQVLKADSSTATGLAWGSDLTGGSGGGVGAGRAIYLTDPPSGSGLSAVLANGTDERAKVQAALDYVESTWGSGYVIGSPGATVKCSSGITIPTQVQLRDTRLDCTAQTGTGFAVTVSDSDFVPLHNVRLDGPSDSSTVKGLSVTGVGNRFERLQIREFGVNIDLGAENTYINTFVQCAIGESALCVNQDFSTTGSSNSGEKTIFRDCTFFNSAQIFNITDNQGGLFVDGCSLDYSALMGYFSTSHVFFTNCHIESNYVATPSGWFFEPAYEARVQFTACNFMLGSTGGEGLRHIIKPSTGPSVNGRGRVIFGDTCTAYFVDTGHNGQQRFADELVWVDAGNTTKTFETPFVSNWGPVTAQPGRYQADTQAQASATVSIGHSSGTVSGAVTVTVPSTVAASTYLPVRVTF